MASHNSANQSFPPSKLESERTSQLPEHLKTKYDNLTQAFKAKDKELNSPVSKRELLEFLDKNLPTGRMFDRQLAEKMFKTFDMDKNAIITVDKFIRSFLSIEEEIKRTAEECQNKYATERENQMKWQKLLMENKGESLNSEGLCDRAVIFLEISDVQYSVQIKGCKELFIRIHIKDVKEDTRTFSTKNQQVILKERFEFKPTTKRDEFILELRGVDLQNNEVSFGLVKFSLETLLKQTEYEIELLIPDDKDERVTAATIKAKITFIWSYFQLYQYLIIQSEQVIPKITNLLDRSNDYLEKLNEPFRMFVAKEEKLQLKDNYSNDITMLSNQQFIKDPEIHTSDHVENFLKKTLKQSSINWTSIIKFLLIISTCLALFNSACRSDFPNLIFPVLILGILLTNFGKNEVTNLMFFFQLILATLVYDILWIYFSSSAYILGNTDENEDSFKSFVFFCSMIVVLVKILLCISLWIKKSKVSHDEGEGVGNVEKPKTVN